MFAQLTIGSTQKICTEHVLKPFFLNQTAVIFSSKLGAFSRRIEFMQRRMLDKLQTKSAKDHVLNMYWDKIESAIHEYVRVRARGAPQCIQLFSEELRNIKPHIRQHVITIYLKQCKILHMIAFTQWRYLSL